MLGQRALTCGCGAETLPRSQCCARCTRRARLSREKFGGKRESVLRRDGYSCLLCGRSHLLIVHHRSHGKLVTLCRRCHAPVHHTGRLRYSCSAFFRKLWREANPGVPEQVPLIGEGGEESPALKQLALF